MGVRFPHRRLSGRSSAWLERLVWDQKVARSNRVAPTRYRMKVSFKEWVIDREWLALWEAVDPSAIAANQINNYLSEKLEVNSNWYATMVAATRRYAVGQDQDSLVSRISTHIIQSLSNPTDKLAQAVQQVQASGNKPGEMVALMTTAIRLRARSFGEVP